MNVARFFLACVTLVATPLIALAGPGDPRLVNGVLEWPRAVTNESFVIVRGDDGILYYVGLGATRRDGTMTAGARVAVLGIEGRSSHEITAVGFGSGATTEAALAQLQGARPPAAAAAAQTPAAPAAVPAPAAAPPGASSTVPVATPPAPSVTAPVAAPPVAAPVAAPPAPGLQATPSAPAAVSPKPSAPAAVPAPAAQASALVAAAPPPVGSSTPPAATAASNTPVVSTPVPPAPGVVPTAATSSKAAVAPQAVALTPPMLPVDDRRWTEVTGEIEAFVGRTVILKVDGGRVTVDVSSLSGNIERIVAPGTKVKFYGVPVELRFKAMGFIDPDARGRVR
jgi:hypothetical protein